MRFFYAPNFVSLCLNTGKIHTAFHTAFFVRLLRGEKSTSKMPRFKERNVNLMLKLALYCVPFAQKHDTSLARLRLYVTYKKTRGANGKMKYHRATFIIPVDFLMKDWDKEAGRVKPQKAYAEANMINIYLGKIESALTQYELACNVNKEEYSKDQISEIVNPILGKRGQAAGNQTHTLHRRFQKVHPIHRNRRTSFQQGQSHSRWHNQEIQGAYRPPKQP